MKIFGNILWTLQNTYLIFSTMLLYLATSSDKGDEINSFMLLVNFLLFVLMFHV